MLPVNPSSVPVVLSVPTVTAVPAHARNAHVTVLRGYVASYVYLASEASPASSVLFETETGHSKNVSK